MVPTHWLAPPAICTSYVGDSYSDSSSLGHQRDIAEMMECDFHPGLDHKRHRGFQLAVWYHLLGVKPATMLWGNSWGPVGKSVWWGTKGSGQQTPKCQGRKGSPSWRWWLLLQPASWPREKPSARTHSWAIPESLTYRNCEVTSVYFCFRPLHRLVIYYAAIDY